MAGARVTRDFGRLLRAAWAQGKHVCVGLDPDPTLLPESIRAGATPLRATVAFCRAIITATQDLVCAYKPNAAFFEALGGPGIDALGTIVAEINAAAPDVAVIYDAKRGDIGSTNAGTVHHAFDLLGADAITVSPYLGRKAMEPFLERAEKGIFVLCRTSNPGAGEFQDLEFADGKKLFEVVASQIVKTWNGRENCGLVMGATDIAALARVRNIVGDLPFLVPGIGAQGGDLAATLDAGRGASGPCMLINASRSILYASSGEDFAAAARRETERLHAEITQ